ncbi:alpha/beta fold hydrolase [Pantoea phytobeneficialis]|uniref:Alpha/beta fold hydrolase n=1 Tax=Pantoea phytobeneficialis TaxID=2052056 RepID=A0AAP9KNY9_9GAMM|nr:alpha/beta fold hydrolase [Pantoea phytobeneficialis]MDO6408058.1 alpha/beta fold hydrolase [Pantoea phytobeneficialis]QGR06430.1 homoserine acetyltransferase [Pantoea phytobeneficialis]
MGLCAFYTPGDLPLASGETLRETAIGYQTFGQLNAARDNAVVIFSYYSGTHERYLPLIGAGKTLDPTHWFIVLVNKLGNGVSSSPSNSRLQPGAAFPSVTLVDNLRAQERLLFDHLAINRIALAYGWSMGAMQAWHLAVARPQQVRALLAVCGSARCWPNNQVFLEGVRAALRCDAQFSDGHYVEPPLRGLAVFGRVYAGWAYSAAFFREARWRDLGFDSLEALLVDWERDHQALDANDLLCALHSWYHADVGVLANGDWRAALARIRARCIVMPCDSDRYFTVEEAALEVAELGQGELRTLVSPYGHCAGAPARFAAASAQIDSAMQALLNP